MKTRIAKTLRAWAQRLSPLPMPNTIEPAPPCYFLPSLYGGTTVLELKKLKYVRDIDRSEIEYLREDLKDGFIKMHADRMKREALEKLDIPYIITEGPRDCKRLEFYLIYYGK